MVHSNREAPYRLNPDLIHIPWVNLRQKLSKNMEGVEGDAVLDRKFVLTNGGVGIPCIPLDPVVGKQEDIPYSKKETQRRAITPEEIKALAAESEYKLEDYGEVTLMFPALTDKPDEAVYQFPCGDKRYAVGRIFCKKDSFRLAVKAIETFKLFNYQSGVQPTRKVWIYTPEHMEKGDNDWYNHTLRPTEEDTDGALLDFLRQFGG